MILNDGYLFPAVWMMALSCVIATAGLCLYQSWRVLQNNRAFSIGFWVLCGIIVFTPSLLVAYAYNISPVWLVKYRLNSPLINELIYSLLLLFKLMPIACFIFVIVPDSQALSSRWVAWQNRGQLRSLSLFDQLGFLQLLPWRGFTVASIISFLMSYGEFEIASRLMVNTWPVRIYDNLVMSGMRFEDVMPMLTQPVLIQLCVLIALFIISMKIKVEAVSLQAQPPKHWLGPGLALLGLALCVIVLFPWLPVLRDVPQGLTAMRQGFGFEENYKASIFFSAVASCVALYFGVLLSQLKGRKAGVSLIVLLPGLLGALMLSFLILNLVNKMQLNTSPLPAIFAITLLILPYSYLLFLALRGRDSTALSVAAIVKASGGKQQRKAMNGVKWQLVSVRRFYVWMLLFMLAWSDLVVNSLLAPPRMRGVYEPLYNMMHYQRTEILSAALALAVLTPIIVVSIAWLGRVVFEKVWTV